MENNKSRSYIIVTPCKDEGENLPNLIQSMVEQKEKPSLWVIVDDGSTDGTPTIISNIQKKLDWVFNVTLEKRSRDIGKHYAYVCNIGFDFAIKKCKEHEIQYDYIGIVDADMKLENEFFNKLIDEFERNPRLGIASGVEYHYDNSSKLISEKMREDLPLGCMRLWIKKCFEDSGKYFSSDFPDSISNVIAKQNGWETKNFNHIRAIQSRQTYSAEGLWKGYKIIGRSDYFRNYYPLYVFAKGLKYICKKPHYLGIAYWFGYMNSSLKRIEQIDNELIQKYYYQTQSQKFKEYFLRLINKKR
ncbi:MAG: glycosyltransferase [Methanosarcinales archaeon]|nr:glycosyltransferase [Methanosarcinales archaeon]